MCWSSYSRWLQNTRSIKNLIIVYTVMCCFDKTHGAAILELFDWMQPLWHNTIIVTLCSCNTFISYYNKHVCVCACVCVRACVCNGRSPEVIRPLAKCYFFLWAMATVGQREGAQWAGIHNASLGLNDRLCTQGWWRVWSSTRPTCDVASRRGSSTWVPLLHIKA